MGLGGTSLLTRCFAVLEVRIGPLPLSIPWAVGFGRVLACLGTVVLCPCVSEDEGTGLSGPERWVNKIKTLSIYRSSDPVNNPLDSRTLTKFQLDVYSSSRKNESRPGGTKHSDVESQETHQEP